MQTKTMIPTKYLEALALVADYLDDMGCPPGPSMTPDAMLNALEDLGYLGDDGDHCTVLTAKGRQVLAGYRASK
jgi:hypothetical protein